MHPQDSLNRDAAVWQRGALSVKPIVYELLAALLLLGDRVTALQVWRVIHDAHVWPATAREPRILDQAHPACWCTSCVFSSCHTELKRMRLSKPNPSQTWT
jgi:hypothetical protein